MTFIIKKKNWKLPSSQLTDEKVFFNRRKFLQTLPKIGILSTPLFSKYAFAQNLKSYKYTSLINKKYILDRKITDEKLATTYTNFYEFGSSKNIWRRASKLNTKKWIIKIDGLVDNPMELEVEELIKLLGGLEERIYRFRCVEAWSMTVPWLGFPVTKLLSKVSPKISAKFIKFQTFFDPEVAPGQKQKWYPWPYVEGITIEEAKNELSFLSTGMYGKTLPNQNGASLRLVLPWKYGFKSIKSIVKISFVNKKPIGMWENLAPNEYGFWANVNPKVSHPRWSQKFEKILGSSSVRETKIYNGYINEVGYLYSNFKNNPILFK